MGTNLPLGLRGKAGGGARVTAGPKRPHLSVPGLHSQAVAWPPRRSAGPLHLSPFSPPNGDRRVDPPALSGRLPGLLGIPQDAAKSLQSCPTLCDPIDGSPPGSPVPGILQARTLEWVAISFSRGSSRIRDRNHVSCFAGADSLRLETSKKPFIRRCARRSTRS